MKLNMKCNNINNCKMLNICFKNRIYLLLDNIYLGNKW